MQKTITVNNEPNGFRVLLLAGFEAVLTPIILVLGQLTSFYVALPAVLIPALYLVKRLANAETRTTPAVVLINKPQWAKHAYKTATSTTTRLKRSVAWQI